MGVALIEKGVLEDAVGIRERLLDVAEAERHRLVDVAGVAVVVDARLGKREALLRFRVGAQRFVFDVDEVERLERGQLVSGDHRGDGVADESGRDRPRARARPG